MNFEGIQRSSENESSESPEPTPEYDQELVGKLTALYERRSALTKELKEVDRLIREARDERNIKHLEAISRKEKV